MNDGELKVVFSSGIKRGNRDWFFNYIRKEIILFADFKAVLVGTGGEYFCYITLKNGYRWSDVGWALVKTFTNGPAFPFLKEVYFSEDQKESICLYPPRPVSVS
jgi:hypothetical protein